MNLFVIANILIILHIKVYKILNKFGQRMQQDSQSSNNNYYNLKHRLLIRQSSLFKLMHFNEDHLIVTAPNHKCLLVIHKASLDGETIRKIKCSNNPASLDLLQVGNKKIIVVGGSDGSIHFKIIANQDQNQEDKQYIQTQTQQIIKLQDGQTYVNDITHWPQTPNIIVNCYNNGNIAVHGLITHKRLHTFQNVHKLYIYKLRFQSKNILVSCGHDKSVMRLDLDKLKTYDFLPHPSPVWCAYPINFNEIASVGLFGRVYVWDVRVNKVVQACNNFGYQSSFITQKDKGSSHLYYGDNNKILRWDRRRMIPDKVSESLMIQSIQGILFCHQNLYACGRGRDIMMLKADENLQATNQFQQYFKTEIISLKQQQVNTSSENMEDQHDQHDQHGQLLNDDDWSDQSQQQLMQQSSMQQQKSSVSQNNTNKNQKIDFQSLFKLNQMNIKNLIEIEQGWACKKEHQHQDVQSQSDIQYQQQSHENIKMQKDNQQNAQQQKKQPIGTNFSLYKYQQNAQNFKNSKIWLQKNSVIKQ